MRYINHITVIYRYITHYDISNYIKIINLLIIYLDIFIYIGWYIEYWYILIYQLRYIRDISRYILIYHCFFDISQYISIYHGHITLIFVDIYRVFAIFFAKNAKFNIDISRYLSIYRIYRRYIAIYRRYIRYFGIYRDISRKNAIFAVIYSQQSGNAYNHVLHHSETKIEFLGRILR